MTLEYKESKIFECRGDMGNEKTKKEKDCLHLSIPSDYLSFYSL